MGQFGATVLITVDLSVAWRTQAVFPDSTAVPPPLMRQIFNLAAESKTPNTSSKARAAAFLSLRACRETVLLRLSPANEQPTNEDRIAIAEEVL